MNNLKLNKLLAYINDNNLFYKYESQRKEIEIENYPILTKSDLIENKKNFLSNNVKNFSKDNLVINSTSGSTGIPLNIYWLKDDYNKSMLSLWRKRNSYYNISPGSKKLSFNYGYQKSDDSNQNDISYMYHISHNGVNLDFSKVVLYDKNLFIAFYNIVKVFNPEWVYIKPHMLKLLVNLMDNFNFKFPDSVKLIECVGETFTLKEKIFLEKKLNIKISNLYGSEEMNGIAYECPFHHMHILEDNVHVECLKEDTISSNGEGIAILTNLNNTLMPFIRYNQGDYIVIDQLSCKCGSKEKIIQSVLGRETEIFYINDKMVTTTLLCELMNHINYELNYPIVHYRFHYFSSLNKLIIDIELKKAFYNWENVIITKTIEDIKGIIRFNEVLVHVKEKMGNKNNSKNKILNIFD